jgi:apolipoprotein N-acyltransferase
MVDLENALTPVPTPTSVQTLCFQIAASLAIGFLFWFVMGLHPVWWLAWVAPVPLLIVAFRFSGPQALWMVFVAALIGASAMFHYRRLVFPLQLVIVVTAGQALVWAMVVMQVRRLVILYKAAWTVLAYPVLWVAVDTLVAVLRHSGNETSLAYTQVECLPILQITSLFGVGGLLFLLTLVPSTLALSIAFGRVLSRAWLAYVGTFVVVAASLAYGFARLQHPIQGRETMLGLVAIDDAIGLKASPAYTKTIWDEYDRHISALRAQGAEIVALPEKIGLLTPTTAAQWQLHLSELATRNHVWLEAGVGIDDGKGLVNRAWLFTPDGTLTAAYQKQHLSPGEVEYVPGNEFVVRSINGHGYGIAICKDMFSAAIGRVYGNMDTAVMLVPAWNPTFEDAWAEGRNTLTRGVENGYAVVRVAREGFMTVSDAYGRVLAEKKSNPLPGSPLLAKLTVADQVPTLYTRTGDLFGWICVAASAVLLSMGRRAKAVSS